MRYAISVLFLTINSASMFIEILEAVPGHDWTIHLIGTFVAGMFWIVFSELDKIKKKVGVDG